MNTCLNCENLFDGSFCNQCGQKAATHRFTMHEWLHEIPHSLFHVDSGFFQTIKTLFRRPGAAVREYLEGKRKSLFSPFLYVLIWCGIYVVVSHLFEKPKAAPPQIKPDDLMAAFAYIEAHYYKIIVVAMIVPTTVGSYLAYYRTGYNFAENLVLNSYLIGQLVIADIILFLLSTAMNGTGMIPVVKFVEFILKYPFWFWMYWQFFKPKKWYWGILQFIASQIITGIALYVLILGAAFALLKIKGGH